MATGTQGIFYEDPRVLLTFRRISTVLSGNRGRRGCGARQGRGIHLNVPLEAGSTDGDYDEVFKALVITVIDQFRPELRLISAGYDAHERDRSRACAFRLQDRRADEVALRGSRRTLSWSRVAVTEGGYDLTALKGCLESTLGVLDGAPSAACRCASSRDTTFSHGHCPGAVRAGQILEVIIVGSQQSTVGISSSVVSLDMPTID